MADCCRWHADGVLWPPDPPPTTLGGPGTTCDRLPGPLVVLICSESVPLTCPEAPFWLKPVPVGADTARLYGYLKLAESERTPASETPSALTPALTRPNFPCSPGVAPNDDPCKQQDGCNQLCVYLCNNKGHISCYKEHFTARSPYHNISFASTE